MRRAGNWGAAAWFSPWLAGCEPAQDQSRRADASVDVAWHRQDLLQLQLEPWAAALGKLGGGHFATEFDRQWQPLAPPTNELTLQSRLVFAMVMGHEFTQDGRYLELARRGTDFLLQRFRDPLHGGFFNKVAANGDVIDPGKRTYGHAFVLLALSHMARVTREPAYAVAALQCWREIRRHFRDGEGGFRAEAQRDFAPNLLWRSQNPTMHLFEALLALVRATRDTSAMQGATELGNFVIGKLLQDQGEHGARIPEIFTEHWLPVVDKERGGHIDLGHQFEWSHLLSTPEGLGLPAAWPAAGQRLLQYALHAGYDNIDGGCYNRTFADGVFDRDKYFWQQAECLSALLVAARRDGRPELWRRYEQTLVMVKGQFIDPEFAGWRYTTKSLCDRGRCGNQRLDPYHMISMHLRALQGAQAAKA